MGKEGGGGGGWDWGGWEWEWEWDGEFGFGGWEGGDEGVGVGEWKGFRRVEMKKFRVDPVVFRFYFMRYR